VINGTLAFMDNDEIDDESYKAPDFPTGYMVMKACEAFKGREFIY
jgi:DNA gyrase/topoisomerase IV subunit A